MIVLGIALVLAVLMGIHPLRVLAKPRSNIDIREVPGSARHFDEMQRIDDADAAASESTLNRLRIKQVRIHPRGLVDEPGTQMLRCVVGVFLLLGDHPSGGQRGHMQGQPDHRLPVRDEIGGIRHTVALDVGRFRILLIRPPVVAFAEEVMLAASTPRAGGGGDSYGFIQQISSGGSEDSLAIDGGYVQGWRRVYNSYG